MFLKRSFAWARKLSSAAAPKIEIVDKRAVADKFKQLAIDQPELTNDNPKIFVQDMIDQMRGRPRNSRVNLSIEEAKKEAD